MVTRCLGLFWALGLFLLVPMRQLSGCTVIAVGKKASRDGSVLVSHTDTGQDSRIRVVPAQDYPAGARVPIYWGIQDAALPLNDDGEILGYLPQVRHTYAYLHSAYSHINEHQLAIAESTTDQKPELVVTRQTGEQIMTVEQVMILALQRCRKAREGVALAGELLGTWGFLPSSGDGSECLVFADPDEIWVFEVFGVGAGWKRGSGKPGAIWAAQRLDDDQAMMIPNWSVIRQIEPRDHERFMVSENYRTEAERRGWYDPRSGKPFVWREAYAPVPMEYATSRFWLFHATFRPDLPGLPDRHQDGSDPWKGISPYYQYVEPLSLYPFSIQPQKPISVQDIMAFQRSTFEGTIYDMTQDPAWLVPDGKGGAQKSPLATPFPNKDLRHLLRLTYRRPVARHRGHYAMIAQLRSWLPDVVGGVYYLSLDNPYFSPYVPIYCGNLSVHPSYQDYDPRRFSEKSARWAIDFVDNLANLAFQPISGEVRAVRDPWEQKIWAEMPMLEEKAVALAGKSITRARRFLTEYCNERMAAVVPMFRHLREEILVHHTNNLE